MISKNIFPARLTSLRKDKDLTQKQLGEHLGTTKQNINNWEKSISTPSVDIVAAIASFFGVTSDYLLGLSDIPSPQFFVDNPELTDSLQKYFINHPSYFVGVIKELKKYAESLNGLSDAPKNDSELDPNIINDAISAISSPMPLNVVIPFFYNIIKSVRIGKDGIYEIEFKD